MAVVDANRGGERIANALGAEPLAPSSEYLLSGEQLVDRLAAGAHQDIAEVVEVAVEEGPADAGATHDLVDG